MGSIEAARELFNRRAWGRAYAELSALDGDEGLANEDLERLAVAAHLIGSGDTDDLWARAHRECARAGERERAVRCAFWLAFGLLIRGETAQGGAWLGRAERLLAGGGECAEHGLLLVPRALGALEGGDAGGALELFTEVARLGQRFDDAELTTFGCLGRGQSLVDLGRCAEGVELLDEAMVAVTGDEVSPLVSGLVYCAAIVTFQHLFDLRRAQEWTAALGRWCDAQPDLVPYRGQCLVHRAEILRLHGAWAEAVREAERACERLAGEPAAGDAHYQIAELHRLRGELDEAEQAYRDATRAGRQPQPGLALLRLAQGEVDTALAAMRRVLDETISLTGRAQVLGPYVEISLAAGDVAAARSAADELEVLAGKIDAPLLHAIAAQSVGAVQLAEGEGLAALASLRRAWTAWQTIEAPYEAARVRLLVAEACRALGDADTAAMELDAARWVFQELGAGPDLDRSAAAAPAAAASGSLTAREVEVLRLVASGRTNRAIAAELFISDKTVARHVSNIFTKVGVSSRSAATAWAYEHGLIEASA